MAIIKAREESYERHMRMRKIKPDYSENVFKELHPAYL